MRARASNPFSLLGGAAALAVVLFAAPVAAPPAHAQGGGHGPNVDDVTGWRCITPFCDVIIQPVTRCLCRKDNPNETVASRVRLTCLPDRRGPACAGSTRFTLH